MKVLVVEDEFLIAAMIEEALTGAGYQVTASVASAQEALDSVQSDKPDLAVIDVRLIGSVDGVALAEELSRRFPPVGILYATGNCEDVLRRAKVGHGCLPKPYRPEWIVSATQLIEAALEGKPGPLAKDAPPGFKYLQ